ncbi:glycosyltransferase family 2 protein [Pseudoprimorskyibacter insulae]|uniref:Uncharacterized protein n=1 Tax=Pseudoprimorskyibacter insulae TaxID=1695997 RepID=A0A2R8ATJ8_9RHOB|nr:glycosyltransferase family 2 protein [Pseudoprimorskyibacter insulae]SPF79371.1 hypothetical protein PRI8871_01166 [Pseudoprimorskyibacter insulae]
MAQAPTPWTAYKLRLKRRRLLWRSFRSRHVLRPVADRTSGIKPPDILCFMTVKNEAQRLPYVLQHHRALGVAQFLIVDNNSTDDTRALLQSQPDVSLWQTGASYRGSRFGVDWMTWLLIRYGHGHWCLTIDADELLIYPDCDRADLPELTAHLAATGQTGLSALMLEMYPKGRLQDQTYRAGQNPTEVLTHFDPYGYRAQRQQPMRNLWVQGGPRDRVFFAEAPDMAPTLNKIPLIHWNRRYAYVNSTHAALPPHLNDVFGPAQVSGALLHTKFLPEVVDRSADPDHRAQHFNRPDQFGDYFDGLAANPDLWCPESLRYTGPKQLEDLGLMQRAAFRAACG